MDCVQILVRAKAKLNLQDKVSIFKDKPESKNQSSSVIPLFTGPAEVATCKSSNF